MLALASCFRQMLPKESAYWSSSTMKSHIKPSSIYQYAAPLKLLSFEVCERLKYSLFWVENFAYLNNLILYFKHA